MNAPDDVRSTVNSVASPAEAAFFVDWTGGRARSLLIGLVSFCIVAGVSIAAIWLSPAASVLDAAARAQPPSGLHWFGTDALGRDLFARTISGLALSVRVGLLASGISTIIALALAFASATMGRAVEAGVSYLVDMTLGLPHLMLLILISFALGGGTFAVIVAVALTHWPRITRILRAEILQVLTSDYVHASRKFGRSWSFIAWNHLLPHSAPQALVGFLLLVPHAILHEAGLTFLGFGFEPSRPAVGVLLSESLRYLSAGYWWFGLFPGLCLVVVVLAFDGVAAGVRALVSPREGQN